VTVVDTGGRVAVFVHPPLHVVTVEVVVYSEVKVVVPSTQVVVAGHVVVYTVVSWVTVVDTGGRVLVLVPHPPSQVVIVEIVVYIEV
jgi:hypothetical protein